MLKINQLLQRHEAFASKLDECLDKAEGSLANTTCTITFPPMPPSPMQPAS